MPVIPQCPDAICEPIQFMLCASAEHFSVLSLPGTGFLPGTAVTVLGTVVSCLYGGLLLAAPTLVTPNEAALLLHCSSGETVGSGYSSLGTVATPLDRPSDNSKHQ